MLLYSLLKKIFTYYPSSAEVARTYAANVSKPMISKLTPLRLAFYAYLLLIGLRLILNSLFRKAYNQYDLPVYLADCTLSHHTAGLAILPCIGLAFVFDYAIVVRPHRKLAPMLLDLLQSEVKSVLSAVVQLFQLVVTLQLGRSSNYSKKSRDVININFRQLSYFRSFTRKTRRRLALADHLIEVVLSVGMPPAVCFLPLALGRFVLLSSYQLYQLGKSPLAIAHLLLEAVPFALLLLYVIRKIILFLKVLLLVVGVFSLHAREVKEAAVAQMQATTVAQFSTHFRRSFTHSWKRRLQRTSVGAATSGLLASHRFSVALGAVWTSGFMREHCRLLTDLVVFNRHFASLLIFWFLLPMIVTSVYILCVLYFLSAPYLLKLFLLDIYCCILLLFAILALLPVVTQALYSADGQLYSAQMRCRVGGGGGGAENGNGKGNAAFLRTKLKLMSYYEVLRTKEKVAFTFGSHAKVDNRWLVELFFLYTSFIMYSFKMFIKRSIKN